MILLDAVPQVGSHESGVEGQNHLPRPAGHTAFDAAQDTNGTLSARVQSVIHQHPQVLLSRAALDLFIPQPTLIPEVALTQVQHLAFGLVKPHFIPMDSPFGWHPILQIVLKISAEVTIERFLEDGMPSRGTWTSLRNWAHGNIMRFDKTKCKVLHLGQSNFLYQYRLGDEQIQNSTAEKDLRMLVMTDWTRADNVPFVSWAASKAV
ncbi:hypothetical protein BTVI_39977 [Pitangus sulphuratus]|nr:hypothetical protein BTVI_39977 [Pitangus sulphuratus]